MINNVEMPVAPRLVRFLEKSLWAPLLIMALAFMVLLPFGTTRYIIEDEGYYLYAAELILQGKTPYADFFYPQMPIFPYLYAGWMWLFGVGWLSARIFTLLQCAGIAALLFLWVRRETGNWLWSSLAVVLFTFNSLTIYSFLTARTFALTVLTALASLILITSHTEKLSSLKAAGAGLLAAICFGCRLMLAPIIPMVLLIGLLRKSNQRWQKASACLLGLGLGLVPIVIFYFQDPAAFVFNNLGFHSYRHTEAGLISDFRQKTEITLGMLGHTFTKGGIGAQFLLLTMVMLGSLARWRTLTVSEWAVILFGVIGVGIALLPTPTYHAYFAVPLPFWIMAATLQLAHYTRHWREQKLTVAVNLKWVGFALALYVLLATPDFVYCSFLYKRFQGGNDQGSGTTLSYKTDCDPKRIREVSDLVRSKARPGDFILSFWSGYLLGTKRQPYPNAESHVTFNHAPLLSRELSAEEFRRYRLLSESDINSIIQNQRVALIVTSFAEHESSNTSWVRKYWEPVISAAGYIPAYEVGQTIIYSLPNRAASN